MGPHNIWQQFKQIFPREYGFKLRWPPLEENEPLSWNEKKEMENKKGKWNPENEVRFTNSTGRIISMPPGIQRGVDGGEILTSSFVVWSLVVKYVWNPAKPITDQMEKKHIKTTITVNGAFLITSNTSCSVFITAREVAERKREIKMQKKSKKRKKITE